MNFKKYLDISEMSSSDTSTTTFFHEMLSGIFIFDPTAQIKTGNDIKKYIDEGKIIPVKTSGGKDGVTPVDMSELKQSRFLSAKEKVDAKYINDAKSIAIKFKNVAKPGTIKKVWWTGPTNDSSKYGAADIVVVSNKGKFPISLKFGSGQLKNLSLNTIGDILGIKTDTNILKDMHGKFKIQFNNMTKKWIEFILESAKKQFGANVTNAFKKELGDTKTWQDYQKQKFDNPDKIYELINIKNKGGEYNFVRKGLSKVYETLNKSQKEQWIQKIRKDYFEKIIGGYFKSHEDKFKKNIKKLFASQLSIQEEDYWYAAKGGKDFKLLPGQKRFDEGIKNLIIEYDFESSGTGYIIPLKVSNKKKELLLEIKIIFRWKFGEMNGELQSASTKSEKIKDWTKYFA